MWFQSERAANERLWNLGMKRSKSEIRKGFLSFVRKVAILHDHEVERKVDKS